MKDNYKYYAFISYKREDEEWAKWLQHEFEHYHLPTTLNGREKLPQEFRPVFRDVDELSAGNLPMQIYQALASSANLIVVCSPLSAKSEWVNKEIQDFIDIGKEIGIDNVEHIFPFIVDGEPHSKDPEMECFPEALRNLDGVKERIGGNINESGRDKAFVKTIAGTMNVGFDSLWNRYEREKIEEEQRKRQERDKLLIMQSRFLSEKIMELAKEDSYLARLLALEILPKDLSNPQDRPFCVEAESALRTACQYKSGILKGRKARFSPDGKKIVAVSTGNSIKIFDVSNGECLHTLEVNSPLVYSAIFSNDGKRIISLIHDKTLKIWDAERGELEKTINTGHSDSVRSVIITHDDKRIITVSWDHTLRVWDVKSGTLITSYEIEGKANDAQIDPKDKKVVVACTDFKYRVYDLNTGDLLCVSSEEHSDNLTSASFSPDGKKIVTTCFNGRDNLKIWDADTGECLHTLEGHKNSVYSAEFSLDGQKLVTASGDLTVRIWDVESGKQIGQPLLGHTGEVKYAMFSPDGDRVISSSYDGTIRMWDLRPFVHNIKMRSRIIPEEITSVGDFSVYITNFNGINFAIYDDSTSRYGGKIIAGHTDIIRSVSFSPDGKYVVSGSHDKTVKVWDVQSGKQVGPTLEHFEEIYSAVFTDDGKKIVAETKSDYTMVWDWKPLQQLIDETREHFKHRELTQEERQKYYLD